jgi:hypothetical protein
MMWSEGGQPDHLTFAGLRGGKGGGGSNIPANTTSQVTNRIDLPPFIQDLAQRNVGRAEDLSNQPFQQFPGQTVAPITPLQQAGYNYVGGQLGATDPVFQKALGQVENLPATTRSLLSPYLADVENAAVSNIQRQGDIARTNLQSGAVGQNAFGGTRYGVEDALLSSETQRNIGQTVAQIESQGWNTAMDAALKQAAAEGSIAGAGQQAGLTGANAAIGAGGAEQTQQQAELAAALQQWQMAQNWPYQQLAVAQGGLAGTPYGTTTMSTQPYAQNTTANLLGNIAAGVGLVGAGSNLFSSGGLFGSQGPILGQSGLFGSGGALAGLFGGLGPTLSAQAGLAGGGEAALGGIGSGLGASGLAGLGFGGAGAAAGLGAADIAAMSAAASPGLLGMLPLALAA